MEMSPPGLQGSWPSRTLLAATNDLPHTVDEPGSEAVGGDVDAMGASKGSCRENGHDLDGLASSGGMRLALAGRSREKQVFCKLEHAEMKK